VGQPGVFFLFCDCFLSRVVGYTAWKDGCTKSKVSELASITDEAFAYLLVENYWEVWSNIDIDQYKYEEAQFDERTSNCLGQVDQEYIWCNEVWWMDK